MTTPHDDEIKVLRNRGARWKQDRLEALRSAKAKNAARLLQDPDGPKAEAYRAQIAEYQESIDNLEAGRPERFTGNPIGANVSEHH